jgi:hypothetical protein
MNIHGCNAEANKNLIPFLLIDAGAKNKLIFNKFTPRYRWTDWSNNADPTVVHRPIVCLDITNFTTLETGLFNGVITTGTNDRHAINQFCAYGMVNTFYIGDAGNEINYFINDPSKVIADIAGNISTIVCRACKHGYKPTYLIDNIAADAKVTDRVGLLVNKCDLIDNCDTNASTSYLNVCTKCNTGYSYKYDADMHVMYSLCF